MILSLVNDPGPLWKKIAFFILILAAVAIVYVRRSMPESQFFAAVLLAVDFTLLAILILFVR